VPNGDVDWWLYGSGALTVRGLDVVPATLASSSTSAAIAETVAR
jgi:hypothetical protein